GAVSRKKRAKERSVPTTAIPYRHLRNVPHSKKQYVLYKAEPIPQYINRALFTPSLKSKGF
ncbi:MAG: hypothetical protein AAFQ61_11920, partial [Cyanobacteria bacterium J06626_23]